MSMISANATAMQPILPLGLTGWDTLPTSKVRRPGTDAPFRWAYSYSGFSLEFARAALKALGAREQSSILDPFLGSGTALVAAADLQCAGFGVDVSPFSALLARTRLSSGVNSERVMAVLSRHSSSKSHEGAEVLGAENAAYVSSVIEGLARSSHVAPTELWESIFNDGDGEHDVEAVVLLSLAMGAREASRLVRGSNPVWLRPVDKREQGSKTDLRNSALAWANLICRDLDTARPKGRKTYRIEVGDIATVNLPKGSFEFCLTSPPYLNRLDYVTASLPELSVLQFVTPFSMQELRKSMIGTTRVVSKSSSATPNELGVLATDILQKIRRHPSYASERYYYHIFAHYFVMLFAALRRIRSSMRKGGKGIIVLQDSFYKDLNVPTPSICVEMLQSLSCTAQVVRTQPVRAHMGLMSPRQTTYVARKILAESLVYFCVT
jgi:hypothetical protein